MIPLQFNQLEDEKKKQVVVKFYEQIIEHRSEIKIKEIDDWCNDNLIIDGKTYNFKSVVCAKYNELIKIKEYIDTNNISLQPFIRVNSKRKKICYIVDTLYDGMGSENRRYIVKKLEVTSCPYCNRNYINSTAEVNTCHLDHFLNKDDYPIFAVSFYNLIPVCPACNVIKGKKEFSYSPHNTNISTDEMIRFSYHFSNVDFLQNRDSLKIDVKVLNDIIRKNIEAVDLENLYQIHSDIVQELIKKSIIYGKTYVEEIMSDYKGLFDSKEEAYRVLFSTYTNEDEYGKRTLSKLMKDILAELDLI